MRSLWGPYKLLRKTSLDFDSNLTAVCECSQDCNFIRKELIDDMQRHTGPSVGLKN